MNRAILAFFFALSVACASAPDGTVVAVLSRLPALGSRFAPHGITVTILGQHVYAVEVDHIRYSVSVNPSTRRVVSILTRDVHFRTPEGVSVGTSVSTLSPFGGRWQSEPHGCLFLLPSGWEVFASSSARDAHPQPTSTPTPAPTSGQSFPPFEVIPMPSCPPTSGSVEQLTLFNHDGA